jgi:hypothetical protein
MTQQLVKLQLKRQYVDLGSIMFKINSPRSRKCSFLPNAFFTEDLFARDYFFAECMTSHLSSKNIVLLNQILLFHQ